MTNSNWDYDHTFVGAEITMTSEGNYTLEYNGTTFTLSFGEDGSVTFTDPGFAADGDSILTKNA